MTLLERLQKRLDLRPSENDTFVGGSGEGGVTSDARLFGGLVAAQATVAALRTVAPPTTLHSLHAYFLRPGRAELDITFRVLRTKEGKNFQVRSVYAEQNGETIFQLQASFQAPEDGPEHAIAAPEVVSPEACPNRDELRGRDPSKMPIDVRMATEITADKDLPPEQRVWLKANGEIPDDPHLHIALVVYASDRTLLDTAWRPHASLGDHAGASLDHVMWFHRAPRFDDWLLYDMTSPAASNARGLALGRMYDQTGRLIVSVAQEGLLRVRPKRETVKKDA
ncbi:MAG: acyl-CoA thioesterase II [Pseudomonadales bacterium]|nr:acyl-CoA thioesterase II [Pseudomonadales bacterium]